MLRGVPSGMLHATHGRDDGMLGEAAQRTELVERLPLLEHARGAVHHRTRPNGAHIGLAQAWPVVQAVEAFAAVRRPVQRHAVTGLHMRDARTDGFHVAGAFVPVHNGHGMLGVAGQHVPVAATDARRRDAHQHLTHLRRLQVDLFDDKRGVGFVHDSGAYLHFLLQLCCDGSNKTYP